MLLHPPEVTYDSSQTVCPDIATGTFVSRVPVGRFTQRTRYLRASAICFEEVVFSSDELARMLWPPGSPLLKRCILTLRLVAPPGTRVSPWCELKKSCCGCESWRSTHDSMAPIAPICETLLTANHASLRF